MQWQTGTCGRSEIIGGDNKHSLVSVSGEILASAMQGTPEFTCNKWLSQEPGGSAPEGSAELSPLFRRLEEVISLSNAPCIKLR